MKSSILKVALINLTLISLVSAQTPDLVLQDNITDDYILYLTGCETEWLNQTGIGGDDAATMKAHMGLAILAFAWSHVDADTLTTDLDPLFGDIEDNLDSLAGQLDEHILPILLAENMDSFFTYLTGFFNSGDYVVFRDSVPEYLENIGADFDDIDGVFQNWLDDLESNFADENFSSHIDSVQAGTADFEFVLQFLGGSYDEDLFVFNRLFLNRLDSLDARGNEMGDAFESAADWFDSVMGDVGGDMMPGVEYLREGLDRMDAVVDTLKLIITSDPFTPLDINTEGLDSLQVAIAELDTLLAGKEYEIGPSEEPKTIKPLAIIQNLPGDGLWEIYEDFYRASDPAAYPFGGIFPSGMPADLLEFVAVDAVLNDADDEDALYNRLQVLKAAWLADLAVDLEDPDAHFGLALVLAYEMVYDHVDIFEDVFRLVSEGRIDSLIFLYSWEDVDLTDEVCSAIEDHMDYYTMAFDTWTNFIILVKTADDDLGPYNIGADTEFDIVQIYVTDAAAARLLLDMATGALDMMIEGVNAIFDEAGDIFVLGLDPTVLDFSQVESDTDLVLLLETSNPDFLTLTPYGIEQFQAAGDNLEEACEQLATFFDYMTDLAYAVAPYDADFGIDGELFVDDMESASDAFWELYTDFAEPGSVTMIDDERVNFSAWFDNPPVSFLIMWKNLLFGIDSTLGGLFPDRFAVGIQPDTPGVMPSRFALYPNYPNPFNPTTRVAFDVPRRGQVSLRIYDLRGNEVAHLVDEVLDPGRKVITWDAREMSSGIYFIRLEHDGRYHSGKMILMK